MFRSLFGGKKSTNKESRSMEFRESWMLANRSLLAILTEARSKDTFLDDDAALNEARQWIRNQKLTFSSDDLKIEQLTDKVLPVVQKIYASANRFTNEADVSSAHNSTSQRILGVVSDNIRSDASLKKVQPSEDLSDRENKIMLEVSTIAAKHWTN